MKIAEKHIERMTKMMFLDFKQTLTGDVVEDEFSIAVFFATLKSIGELKYLDGFAKLSEGEQDMITTLLAE